MQITKEYLETKRASLEHGMAEAMADYNACKGAVQLVDLLLGELGKEELPPPPPQTTPSETK